MRSSPFIALNFLLLALPRWADGESSPDFETTIHGAKSPGEESAGFSSTVTWEHADAGHDVGTVLNNVPGLRIRDAGVGQSQTISLRGSEGHQAAVFLDGVRITSPGRSQVDLSLFDPGQLDHIAVYHSAGSARFGGNALSGAVVLQTSSLRTGEHYNAGMSYGPWNSIAGRAGHQGDIGSWRYSISGRYAQTDGDFAFVDHNGQASIRENNDRKGGQALLKVDRVGSSSHFEVLNWFGMSDAGAPGPTQSPSLTARQTSIQNVTSLRTTLFDLLGASDQLSLSIFHRYGYFSFDEPVGPPPVLSTNNSFGPGGSANLKWRWTPAVRFETGFEIRDEIFRDDSTSNPTRLENDFWLANTTLLWQERIRLEPAVRAMLAQGYDAAVVPEFGVLVSPWRQSANAWISGLGFAANAGRNYRFPSFQELYIRVDGFGGNPDLDPEDAVQIDAGVRWKNPRGEIAVVGFQRWISNTILYAPVSATLVRPDNYSDAIAQGLESSIDFALLWGFAAQFAYTFTKTRFGDPPLQLPGHPQHRWNGGLRWDGRRARTWKWLTLWTNTVVESDMVLDRFNAVHEEGRVLLAAGGLARYRQFTFSAEGRNLLDKRDAVDTVGFPLAPARFLVSAAADF